MNGTGLHRDEFGPADGPPVVLIHGHPFDRTLWAPQTTCLAEAGYRVITPDLRGYGLSAVTPGTVSLADFADDIAALLDLLGIDRAVVGGVSMGGQIALEFLRGHRHRVAALVLVDTSAAADTEAERAARHRLADRLVAEGMAGYAHEAIDTMIAPYNVTALPDVAAHVLAMMRATDPHGAAAAQRGRAERPDHRGVLAAADVPVLIVVGEDDVHTPPAVAESMHRLAPHARYAVVAGAGHLPNVEQPGEFNAHLLGFLQAALRRGPLPQGAVAGARRAGILDGAGPGRRFTTPATGDERRMLLAVLGDQRATLQLKCAGLDAELSHRAVEPSTLSLLGLVRHLADVERRWFRSVLAGHDAPPYFSSAGDPDGDFDGARPDPAVAAAAWDAWRAEVEFADRFAAEAPHLDVEGEDAWRGRVSLRWVLIHMIEEYARHNGHADLLRERIDGARGL